MADEERREGGCLCGEIRFVAAGAPRRTIACHCTFCQRFTGGGAYLIETLFFRENVRFRGRALSEYVHRSDRSGRHLTLQFCSRCGTTVGMTLEWNPRTQSILSGCFDDPSSVTPELHIFADSARRDTWLPADLPCYREHYLRDDLSLDEGASPVRSATPWQVAMLDHQPRTHGGREKHAAASQPRATAQRSAPRK